jgi:excisionase family DNA binding protein
MPEKFFLPKQVAPRIGVSTKSVVRLCQRGQLTHLYSGRFYRIPESAIEQYLRTHIRVAGVRP